GGIDPVSLVPDTMTGAVKSLLRGECGAWYIRPYLLQYAGRQRSAVTPSGLIQMWYGDPLVRDGDAVRVRPGPKVENAMQVPVLFFNPAAAVGTDARWPGEIDSLSLRTSGRGSFANLKIQVTSPGTTRWVLTPVFVSGSLFDDGDENSLAAVVACPQRFC